MITETKCRYGYNDLSPVTLSHTTHRPDLIGKKWLCHWDHENNIPLAHDGDHSHRIVDAYEDHRIILPECKLCLMLDNGMHLKSVHSKYIVN